MKTALAILFLLGVSVSLGRSEIPLIPESVADSSLVAGNNRFAMSLFEEVVGMHEGDNVFISPYSISAALGMTWNGAIGSTATEMSRTLNFQMPVYYVNRAFQRVTAGMTSGTVENPEEGESFTLTVANGIWVDEGFELLDSYLSAVEEFYSAGVANLDFAGDPEGSREIINQWVAENTMNRILDLIPRGLLGADTRVVLTNAVYFKASWAFAFQPEATFDDRFLIPEEAPVEVPFMHRTEFYPYASSDEWQAVSMAYSGGTASMLVILPRDMNSFMASFDTETLEGMNGRLGRTNLELSLPRFEFTRAVALSEILSSMGMENAFGSSANFSAMTGGRDLFISEVLHKAFVKVDESGTEAAAATAVVMNITAMPAPPVEMNVNRPFMFIIQDHTTGSILFMGLVNDPRG